MARFAYQGTYKDQNGKVVGALTTANSTDGVVYVYLAGTTTAASVYTASAGGTAVNSVETDDYGHFIFYVDTDDYSASQKFKITLTHANFENKTYDNIQIFPFSWNHVSSTDLGTSHVYIDQDVRSSAAPTFTGTNFTEIPASGISSTDRSGNETNLITGGGSTDGAFIRSSTTGDIESSSFFSTDIDMDLVVTNSTTTNITQAELEELTNGSTTVLHTHSSLWQYGSQTATTSSTAVNLSTDISTDARDVEIMFSGVSCNTDNTSPLVQLGDDGGFEETGYRAAVSRVTDGAGTEIESTNGFLTGRTNDIDANNSIDGIMRLSRWATSEDQWIADWLIYSDTTNYIYYGAGKKTLSGNLTSVRLVTNSTAAFDAGEATIRYK